MPTEDEFSPDPGKITVRGGVIFNPWINVSVSLIFTLGLGWMTAWFWGMWMDAIDAPPYEDQGLDIAGGLIGVAFTGLATLALFVVTIWLIVWWAKRSGQKRRA